MVETKEEFLKRITSSSKSKYKYKRVVSSPIRYPGGKSMGVGFIVELLPEGLNRVVSPFFGGGSVEIALSKYLGFEIEGFDIFDILINYWRMQINEPESLYNELAKLKPDTETFNCAKDLLEDHWDKTTKTFDEWSAMCNRKIRYKNFSDKDKILEWDRKSILDPLKLATYYYFTYNLSYGPGFLGWSGGIYLNDKKYASMLKKVRTFAPGNLKVGCADFKDVISEYKNDFLYCDPPYYIGPGSKTFRGIYPMRNIPIHHDGFDHSALAKLLREHRGGFILSYNNCPFIAETYSGLEFHYPEWQYTMGQGETRIGNNRSVGDLGYVKKSHEVLVFKPPV